MKYIKNRKYHANTNGVGGRPRNKPGNMEPVPKKPAPENHHVSVTLSKRTVKILIAVIAGGAAAIIIFILSQNGVFSSLSATKTPKATQIKFSEKDMDVSQIDLNGQKIIIDAAHSPNNPGNKTSGALYEETLTYKIAEKVKNNLEAKGAQVIMTRDSNNPPASDEAADTAARNDLIRSAQSDMVVSIHMNWYDDETASGAQTFFREQGAKGKRIAVAIEDMLNYKLKFENPRIPIEGAYEILGVGAQPSVVVECGFLSNPEEAALLNTDEYQNQLAEAISDGILLYRKRFADIIEKERIEAEASDAAAAALKSAVPVPYQSPAINAAPTQTAIPTGLAPALSANPTAPLASANTMNNGV